VTGDAVNVRQGGMHHAMLFGRWLDAKHTRACVLQENVTGTPANLRAYASSYMTTFHPIRANKMPDEGAPLSQSSSPPTSGGGAGAPCSNDGACNPGSDGSGQICVDGSCVPGCRQDTQCPGSSRCIGGNCQ
jgi:hypothetical protein